MFLTNNPTRDPQMYLDKLTALGIPTGPDEILNTVMTMTSWLVENAADKKIFVIGEQPLKYALWSPPACSLTDRRAARSTSSSPATTAPSTTANCRSRSTRSRSTAGPSW